MVPLPVPLESVRRPDDANVTNEASLATLHGQPAGDVTSIVPEPPSFGIAICAGAIPHVHEEALDAVASCARISRFAGAPVLPLTRGPANVDPPSVENQPRCCCGPLVSAAKPTPPAGFGET